MDGQEDWVDVGSVEELARTPLKSCKAQAIPIAISFKDGQFGAVSNVCNHVGGPLGDGRLDGDYITCPWHGWKFHRGTGVGEPTQRSQVSRLRGLLFESGASLHMALLDHANGC